MSGETRAASIRDVARRAHVSHMTVSRVLNGSANVRESTREQVLAAITELNFRPNRVARALASGGMNMLGILDASEGVLFGPSNTIWAIEQAARKVGYSTIVAGVDPDDRESVARAIEHLLNQNASGLIVIGPSRYARTALADLAPDVPIVTMHGTDDGPAITVQAEAARVATRYLLDLGHTRLAHIAGPANWVEATARQRGFLDALESAGLEPVAIERSDWSAQSGYEAAKRLLDGPAFTAVFCANDPIALGFIHAAAEAGVDVPGQISVIGFDNEPESAHFRPPLTTLPLDFAEAGRRAVVSVLAAIDQAPEPTDSLVVPELVVRESTAPCPGRG